jgi:hypothetical protein
MSYFYKTIVLMQEPLGNRPKGIDTGLYTAESEYRVNKADALLSAYYLARISLDASYC